MLPYRQQHNDNDDDWTACLKSLYLFPEAIKFEDQSKNRGQTFLQLLNLPYTWLEVKF